MLLRFTVQQWIVSGMDVESCFVDKFRDENDSGPVSSRIEAVVKVSMKEKKKIQRGEGDETRSELRNSAGVRGREILTEVYVRDFLRGERHYSQGLVPCRVDYPFTTSHKVLKGLYSLWRFCASLGTQRSTLVKKTSGNNAGPFFRSGKRGKKWVGARKKEGRRIIFECYGSLTGCLTLRGCTVFKEHNEGPCATWNEGKLLWGFFA